MDLLKRVDEKLSDACCGCCECEFVCPTKAIRMERNELGFLFPKVDEKKCIHCCKCIKKCKFSEDYPKGEFAYEPIIYAGRLRDTGKLKESQSGGAFCALAEAVLSKKGVVYGASYMPDNSVSHVRIDSLDQLGRLKGSKYVQSNMSKVYDSIKKDLDADLLVLFSGTPCQVAGVRSAFRTNKHGELLTVDLLCHGVSSPMVWSDYIQYLQKKQKAKIVLPNMRNKLMGWRNACETYTYETGKCEKRDTFLHLYFSHYIHRDCCFKCPFTNLRRVGDFSIGDFWHWEKTDHDCFNDNLGISLIFINTKAGKDFSPAISDSMILVKSNSDECMQNVLDHPAKPNPKYKQFQTYYSRHGFVATAKKFGNLSILFKIKILLAKLLHYSK